MTAALRVNAGVQFRTLAAALAFLIPVALPGTASAQDAAFQFAAIGDTAYSMKSEAEFDRMLAAMNKEKLAFVVHVGDFEADPRPYARNPDKISMPCTEESFGRVLASFQKSAHPLVLTPGDNDWTDCHLLKAQKVDPLEALAKLRTMFFPEGKSLGAKTIAVESQAKDAGFAKFRENLTWTQGGLVFATFHTVGSNDNKGRTPETDAEQAEREAANLAWIKKTFAAARQPNVPGLVLITQANVQFENQWTPSLRERYVRAVAGAEIPKEPKATAYDPYANLLAEARDGRSREAGAVRDRAGDHRGEQGKLSAGRVGKPFPRHGRAGKFTQPAQAWLRARP